MNEAVSSDAPAAGCAARAEYGDIRHRRAEHDLWKGQTPQDRRCDMTEELRLGHGDGVRKHGSQVRVGVVRRRRGIAACGIAVAR